MAHMALLMNMHMAEGEEGEEGGGDGMLWLAHDTSTVYTPPSCVFRHKLSDSD